MKKDYKEGKISISEEALASIISNALEEVPEVKVLGRWLKPAAGVTVSMDEKPSVKLKIAVKYGFSVIEAAKKVQESVKRALRSSAGFEAKAVEVEVEKVFFD